MRRDKTLKVCANHIGEWMGLIPLRLAKTGLVGEDFSTRG